MPRLSVNLLRWNTKWEDVRAVMDAALIQTYQDFELVYSENGDPKLIDQVREYYKNNPKVRVVDNGGNLGFAPGQNKFFAEAKTELVMLLNPDAVMTPTFIEELIKAFDDPKVGAATGKMIKPEKNEKGETIIDGTGIIIYKSRRARERGQLEADHGQYDSQNNVFGVSGSAPIYRRSALDAAAVNGEYFDPEFFAYWEDLDLSWRLQLAGFEARYMPKAIIYHERAVGVSPGGYKKLFTFVKHHAKFPVKVRRWNWRNHLFCIVKNDFGWNFWKSFPRVLVRETAMLGYITIFEPRTLGAIPDFFHLLPKMLAKRSVIQKNRKVTSKQMEKWFI